MSYINDKIRASIKKIREVEAAMDRYDNNPWRVEKLRKDLLTLKADLNNLLYLKFFIRGK